jgi:hypothetical protein
MKWGTNMGGEGSGRQKKPPAPKKIVKNIIPIEEIFTTQEASIYHDFVDVYLVDFDNEDLTSGDMDDIMDLAKNRVIEFRLLKTSRDDADRQVDISAALEKIRKENKVLKENLATRRKDRINPNELKGFSIVDLAVAFDEDKKVKLQEQIRKNIEEEELILKSREGYTGNRYDVEAEITEGDDD